MADPASPLVTVPWLAAHLDDPRVVVADVRWYLSGKRAADEYARGHLPRAAFVDVDAELASPPGPGRPGRHPLPSAAQVSAVLSRLGAGPDTTVVAYDDAGGGIAARLWWLLRYFGHGGGRVLDGGLQAWTASGRPLVTDSHAARPAPPLALVPDPRMVVDKRRVAALARSPAGLVLDARAPERFEGKVEPIDARPGHVPGARNAPFVENLVAPEGPFRDRADLARRYAALGADRAETIAAYCGSGLTACHDLLALALAGRPDGLLYEGSWSDWAADPALPAAQGKA
jgi:thiosulfate/3-mercaptopyruvate sulfurtransferase